MKACLQSNQCTVPEITTLLQDKCFTFGGHTCSFTSIIHLSNPCLAVVFLFQSLRSACHIHKYSTFGSPICSFTSIIVYVFFVWQMYFFFLINAKDF